MKDYYKIGEISKIYGIGRDSLMYYEDIGILKPFRDKNGYRMYKLSDIWRLNLIKELRSLNFPMKKIKEYLDDRNIESTKEILNKEIILIDEKIEELLSYKQNIMKRLDTINDELRNLKLYEIDLVYINKRKDLELNANITKDEEFDFLIQKLQLHGHLLVIFIYKLSPIVYNIFIIFSPPLYFFQKNLAFKFHFI